MAWWDRPVRGSAAPTQSRWAFKGVEVSTEASRKYWANMRARQGQEVTMRLFHANQDMIRIGPENAAASKYGLYQYQLEQAQEAYRQFATGDTLIASMLEEMKKAKIADFMANASSLSRGVEDAYAAMEASCRNAGELALLRSIKDRWISAMTQQAVPDFYTYLNHWTTKVG